MVYSGWEGRTGRGGREKIQRNTSTFFGVMEMFIILIVVVVSQVCTCVITNQIAHFQYVCFIICQLYLKKFNEKRIKNEMVSLTKGFSYMTTFSQSS